MYQFLVNISNVNDNFTPFGFTDNRQETKIELKNLQILRHFDCNPQETTSDSIDRLLERVVVFYRLFCQVTCE